MRAKAIITFTIILIVTLASAFELSMAVANIFRNSPVDITKANLVRSESEQYWIGGGRGRHKVTITPAQIDGRHAIIIGDVGDSGWLLPVLHKARFEQFAPEAPVLQYYRWHPTIRYSIGALICLTIFYFGSRVSLDIFKEIMQQSQLPYPKK